MYYHGVDAQTRRAIEMAEAERAKAIAAFWTSLFAVFARRAPKALPLGAARA